MAAALDIAKIIEARQPERFGRSRRPRRSSRPKTIRPIPRRPADEVAYRRELLGLVEVITERVERILIPLLESLEPEFLRDSVEELLTLQSDIAETAAKAIVQDAFEEELDDAFRGIRQQFEDLEQFATSRAERMVGTVNRAHEIRYMRELQRKVGIDARGLIQSEGLESTLRATTKVNVNLIESIPAEYFGKIEKLVYQNTLTGRTDAKSLRKSILEIGETTAGRAKVIARDQVAKLNSAVNEERNLALGIEEYIWRATGGKAGDGRTRDRHRKAHGNVYRFDDPKVKGSISGVVGPGEDVQCRCTAEAIIPGF